VLDIKLLRERTDDVRAALARRGVAHLIDDVLAADATRRDVVVRIESIKKEQNDISRLIGRSPPAEREPLLEQARRLKVDVEVLEPRVREAEEQLDMLMAGLPNLPDASVPDGDSEDDNVEVRRWGEPRRIDQAADHLDIGRRLGIIDTERAARASGSRFGYLLADAVLLEFALVRLALDRLLPRGFVPVSPPVLVNREVMFGAGDLPADEAQYYVTVDGQYLTGTSEQALAALHMEEDLDASSLPLRYTAFSSCFRREAGTYGRDTRGIFRVHQFDKVEMFSFTQPDQSWEELELLLAIEEELFQALELPYRVVNCCAGELGAKAAKKYDIEAWFPGQEKYRELTSASNCTDYQARRLRIRTKIDGRRREVHTLNATAFGLSRTIACLLENYQEPSGEVLVPKVLREHGAPDVIAPR
jgi:seryl-tRNA synthetase